MKKLALKFLVCCGAFILLGQCYTCANGSKVNSCSGCTDCKQGRGGSVQDCKACCLECCQEQHGERLSCQGRCALRPTEAMPVPVDPAIEQLMH
jgi:hypothetical protein